MSSTEMIHTALPAHRGYVSRILIYCREMFPLPIRLINAAVLYVGFAIFFSRVNGLPVQLISSWSLLGIANLFLLALLLRLMDEIKDLEIDLRLFTDRPVPAGKVTVVDIRRSIAAVTAGYIAINLAAPSTLWISLLGLVYTYLMFAYFFMPGLLRRHLLLNVATHNPSVPLMLLMVVAIVATQHKVPLDSVDWPPTIAAIAALWSLLLGWELARKIRSAEEENDYVTYSQIFGRVPSSLITLTIQSAGAVISAYLGYKLNFSFVFFVILGAAYALVIFGHLRFILRPSRVSSKLKPFAESYTMLVITAFVADYVFSLVWRIQ